MMNSINLFFVSTFLLILAYVKWFSAASAEVSLGNLDVIRKMLSSSAKAGLFWPTFCMNNKNFKDSSVSIRTSDSIILQGMFRGRQ